MTNVYTREPQHRHRDTSFQTELLGPICSRHLPPYPLLDSHRSASAPQIHVTLLKLHTTEVHTVPWYWLGRTAVNTMAGRLKPQKFVISHLEDELGRTRPSCQWVRFFRGLCLADGGLPSVLTWSSPWGAQPWCLPPFIGTPAPWIRAPPYM